MAECQKPEALPIPVKRALHKLGVDIRSARIRRRIPTAIMAERASISRTTLLKIEKGEPGVSLGKVATVLFVLGLHDRLAELADIRFDPVGQELQDNELPQRVRHPGSKTSGAKKKGDS